MRRYQQGDAMAIIVVILVIALVGALGFIAWQNFGKKNGIENATESSQQSNKSEKSPTSEEKKEAVLAFADWSVEMPIVDELKDASIGERVSGSGSNEFYGITVKDSVLLNDSSLNGVTEIGRCYRIGMHEEVMTPMTNGINGSTVAELRKEGSSNITVLGDYGYMCFSMYDMNVSLPHPAGDPVMSAKADVMGQAILRQAKQLRLID